MAPKKAAPVDKKKQAAKQKAVEDKTFGLKNKNKSVKVQQFVQNMKTNVTCNMPKPDNKKEKRLAEEAAKKEIDSLFRVAIKQPKAPEGVDPKSIVCEFFRHGQCTKGAQCKYSHDLEVERKVAKIDLFTDQRELGGGDDDEEGMAEWDQAQLEQAIRQKHANENKPTGIVCKFFLDAVEKRMYGWFWKCPNGEDCKYRHALPPGYILKSQMKELLEEEARNTKDITDHIEEERAKVEARTPITEETFRMWHSRKQEAKATARANAEEERRKKGVLNGREIFMQEGFIAIDDTAAGDDWMQKEDDEEAQIKEMMAQAAAAAERARMEREAAGPEAEEGDPGAGPSTSSGAGPSKQTHLALGEGEAEALFDGDDDDDEDMEDDDEEEGPGDDDEEDEGGDEDEDLDALAEQVKGMHAAGK